MAAWNKQEELELFHAVTAALMEQQMWWDSSCMVGTLWWMDSGSLGETGKEDRKTQRSLHIKKQLERLWWMAVWLRVDQNWTELGSEKKPLRVKRMWQCYYRAAHWGDEDSQALEQVAQRGCAVSILGVFQVLAREIPEESGLISQLIL